MQADTWTRNGLEIPAATVTDPWIDAESRLQQLMERPRGSISDPQSPIAPRPELQNRPVAIDSVSPNPGMSLMGGWDDDVLVGGAGDDVLTGLWGNDKLLGGAGNDQLSGDWGNDLLDGGAGNDVLSGGWDNDKLYGGAGNDQLSGDWGNDLLDGGAGDDVLKGLWDDDKLFGDVGNDWLSGDWGNDILRGGAGNDTLSGGSGNDQFVYSRPIAGPSGDGHDVIRDFTSGEDKLMLAFGPTAPAPLTIRTVDTNGDRFLDATVISLAGKPDWSVTLLGVTHFNVATDLQASFPLV